MAFGGGKWNSFREYIQSKNEKVKEQLSERAEVVSAIFEGCCFLINGKSDVTDAVLKRLLFAHGGKYDMYGGTHTHLVADNLAAGNQRWKQLRERQKFSRFQVVTSTWILDSVEAGKRLPESRYLPECLQISTRQQRELFPKAILKCTDPGFVQSYFKQSRLHLLGRWRSWLRQAYRFRAFESLADSSGLGRWSPHRKSIVLHVDFDAFFVNVALRSRPDLSGRPVGVAHGSGGGSNSELASVNYEARAYGVHNGQWVSSAKKLCPSLITVPYDFEGIKECSLQLFSILSEVTDRVLPASCDEAYLQLVDEGECAQAAYIASYVRDAVLKATRIAVSVGIGPNLLLAKLAGLQAKPVPRGVLDTACYLSENPTLLRVEGVSAAPPLVSSPVVQEGWRRLEALAEVDGAIPVELLDPWPAIRLWMRQWMLRDLPGVGARIEQQLREEGLVTCGDLQDRTTVAGLKMVVGEALGLKLSRFAEGHDPRPVPAPFHGMQEQITIQVNWGIRLTSEADFEIMLDQLAVEAAGRCHDDACVASAVSLRLLIRAEGAPMEPAKPLGCGLCDPRNSSSHKLAEPAAASESIRYALQICWREIQPLVVVSDVRGMGAHLQTSGVSLVEDIPNADILLRKRPTLRDKYAREIQCPPTKRQRVQSPALTRSSHSLYIAGRAVRLARALQDIHETCVREVAALTLEWRIPCFDKDLWQRLATWAVQHLLAHPGRVGPVGDSPAGYQAALRATLKGADSGLPDLFWYLFLAEGYLDEGLVWFPSERLCCHEQCIGIQIEEVLAVPSQNVEPTDWPLCSWPEEPSRVALTGPTASAMVVALVSLMLRDRAFPWLCHVVAIRAALRAVSGDVGGDRFFLRWARSNVTKELTSDLLTLCVEEMRDLVGRAVWGVAVRDILRRYCPVVTPQLVLSLCSLRQEPPEADNTLQCLCRRLLPHGAAILYAQVLT